MKTNGSPSDGKQGFTLIEVVIAMVILAVGLLGLEALGIRAVRMVAAGKKQSEYAVLASSRIERARYQISANPAALTTGTQTEAVSMTGGTVNVATQVTSPANVSSPYVVTVTVTPSAQANAPQPFSMTSYVYSQ